MSQSPTDSSGTAPSDTSAITPQEALAQRPDDVAALAAYATWLQEDGDPLGEYVELICKLRALDASSPEYEQLSREASSLYAPYRHIWLHAWNDPFPLFDYLDDPTSGLPSHVELSYVPRDVASLDEQLGRLPIRSLTVDDMKAKEITQLSALRTLRHLTELTLIGSEKRKLDHETITWLAETKLTNLKTLHLKDVDMRESNGGQLLESLEGLRSLTIENCQIDDAFFHAMSDAKNVDQITHLSARFNPVTSDALRSLEKWKGLQSLDLNHCDVDDGITALGEQNFDVKTLRLVRNGRLGTTGIEWVVKAFPKLQNLELPRHVEPESVEALAAVASTLHTLRAEGINRPTVKALVEKVLPKASTLRKLDLSQSATDGALCAEILRTTKLEELDIEGGELNDEDLAVIAACKDNGQLRWLRLGGSFSDAAIDALANSSELKSLDFLGLQSTQLTQVGVRTLLRSEVFVDLNTLWIRDAVIDDVSPISLESDVRLHLAGCNIDSDDARRLRAFWGPRLKVDE